MIHPPAPVKNGTHPHPEVVREAPAPLPSSEPVFPPRGQGWGRALGLPLLAALVCGAAAFGVGLVLPPAYHAETTLYFNSGGDPTAASIIGTLSGGGALPSPADRSGNVPLLGGLMTSPQIASGPNTAIAVLDSDRCRDLVIKDCALKSRWHETKRATVRQRLDDAVSFGVDKNGLLAVEVIDRNPQLAAKIARSYIKNLKAISVKMSAGRSRENRQFVQRQLHEAKTEQALDEARMLTLQQRNTRINPLATGAAAAKIGDVYAQLFADQFKAQNELAATNAQIAKQRALAKASLSESANLPAETPYGQVARAQLRTLETQFAADKETLGPDNPDFQAHQAQLNAARTQVKSEVGRAVHALQKGISADTALLYATQASLQARRDGLNQAVRKIEKALEALPDAQMREARLTAEIKLDQAQVASLVTNLSQARMAEQRDAATFQVMDAPDVPDEPYAPRKKFLIAFAALAGFLLVLAWRAGQAVMQQPTAGATPVIPASARTRETV